MDSGEGYGGLTELAEILGTGVKLLQNFQTFQELLWHGRTELSEVPGGWVLNPHPGYRGTGYTELT